MSEPGRLDILGDVLDLLERQQAYATALREYVTLCATEIERLWTGQAEMRDDLHAVANRVESASRLLSDHVHVAARLPHVAPLDDGAA